MLHGIPQGSVLGPLLFIIYINDLHNCIKSSETYHFADDTHLFHVLKKHNGKYRTRKLNNDLKALTHWLLANKISLNASKTEMIYFRKKGTQRPELKIVLNGIKIEPKSKIKYLGLIFDEHLTWIPHINTIVSKLKRANNLLAISRHYVPKEILLQIYYAQFSSHMNYGCQVWGQNISEKSPMFIQQKKALRLITFSSFREHTSPLFKSMRILKIKDNIEMQNILLAHKSLNNSCPTDLQNKITLSTTNHNHQTRNQVSSRYGVPDGCIRVLDNIKSEYWKETAKNWNHRLKAISQDNQQDTNAKVGNNQSKNKETNFSKVSISVLKKLLKDHFLSTY